MTQNTDEQPFARWYRYTIKEDADKLMLLIDVVNDFYTENSRRLSKFGHFSEVDLRWTFS